MPSQTGRRAVARRSLLAVPLAAASVFTAPAAPAQTAADQPAPLETVVITANGSQVELPPAYAGGQVADGGRVGLFGNLALMDTPFNSTNYTAELMQNQQSRSVADVVQNDPAVRVARGFGNFQELYVVRGFPVYSDDMSYNGLYGLLPRQYVAAEFLERVEVFRGANSFLNGAAPGGSGIGGSFNLVPKRAPSQDLTRVTLGFENEGQGYVAADVARRFGDGDRFGFRVNGVRRDGDTAIDDENRKLSVLSLGADYRGERARFSADLGWQDHHISAPRPSVTPFGGVPDAPDASSNFAQDWTFTDERDLFGVARGEFDLTEKAKLWAAVGVRDSEEHNILSNPTSDATGATSAYRFDNYREDLVTTGEIGVRGEFDTGAVGHRVSTTASAFKLDSKNAYAFSSFAGFAGNLYNPINVAPPTADFFTGGVLFSPLTTTKIETSSVALADTLAFMDKRLLVTVGARYQTIKQFGYNYNTGAQESAYDKNAVTPAGGIVFKPASRVSLYANYIEGLLQGGQAPPTVTINGAPVPVANSGEVFEPFKSKQGEVGIKYDAGTFGATAAVFRITQPNTVLIGNVVGPEGEQRNQGVELSWYGEPRPGLRVLGGLTLLQAELTKTQSGINEGNDVIGVADTQANFGVEWDVAAVRGVTLDARAVYTSSQAANVENTLEIPSWTRLDLGARYKVSLSGRDLTVRGRVDNVTDRNYWASVGGSFGANYLVLGSPRTFVLSASMDF